MFGTGKQQCYNDLAFFFVPVPQREGLFCLENIMKKIPLTQGQFALVDDEDYEWLIAWKWSANKVNKTFYAFRKEWNHGNQKTIYMHRLIMNAPENKLVDHNDMNGLNNQRHNLRLGNKSKNGANRGIDKDNTTGYKGVTICTSSKRRKKYIAQIGYKGEHIQLGYFLTAEDAARAYDKKAKELFDEFAYTNFK